MLKVKDVCQMPKEKPKYEEAIINTTPANYGTHLALEHYGYNTALNEISNLPIDLSKVLDAEKLEKMIQKHKWEMAKKVFQFKENVSEITFHSCSTSKELVKAIIANINSCVKDKI